MKYIIAIILGIGGFWFFAYLSGNGPEWANIPSIFSAWFCIAVTMGYCFFRYLGTPARREYELKLAKIKAERDRLINSL